MKTHHELICGNDHEGIFGALSWGIPATRRKGAGERGNGGVHRCTQSCLYVQTCVNNIGLVSTRE